MTEIEGLDDLYAGPLDEFVSRRNALARSLKDADHGASAAEVKARKKPSVSAWVVNQLAHHHADELKKLIDAAEAMEGEQRKSLAGEASDLSTAKRQEQEAIARLRGIAAEEVTPAMTTATLERVTNSLLNGARSSDGRAALAIGRLEADLEPPGFDAYAGFAVPSPPPAKPHREKKTPRRKPSKPEPGAPSSTATEASGTDRSESTLEMLEVQVGAAREAARVCRVEADEAERKASEAKQEADLLARQASDASRRADEAQDELDRLQTEIEALRS